MNKEQELAQEVLTAIEHEEEAKIVDYYFKRYYRSIIGKTYDVKLFNKIDHKHTKYLLKQYTRED